MFTCNFKGPYIDEDKAELLLCWTLRVHFIQNLIEDDIGRDNARCSTYKKHDNQKKMRYVHLIAPALSGFSSYTSRTFMSLLTAQMMTMMTSNKIPSG